MGSLLSRERKIFYNRKEAEHDGRNNDILVKDIGFSNVIISTIHLIDQLVLDQLDLYLPLVLAWVICEFLYGKLHPVDTRLMYYQSMDITEFIDFVIRNEIITPRMRLILPSKHPMYKELKCIFKVPIGPITYTLNNYDCPRDSHILRMEHQIYFPIDKRHPIEHFVTNYARSCPICNYLWWNRAGVKGRRWSIKQDVLSSGPVNTIILTTNAF